jgi:hypothetical protein
VKGDEEEDDIIATFQKMKTGPIVQAGNQYGLWMLTCQPFASLFRHYAKYHNLQEKDLEYYYNGHCLLHDDTPESIHIQSKDKIMVRMKHHSPQEVFLDATQELEGQDETTT